MTWSNLFQIVNLAALILWLVLVIAPRWHGIFDQFRLVGVGALCCFYVVLVSTALSAGFGAGSGTAPDFSTVAGIRAIFATDGGVVTGWTHYLAFDLFAGIWIAEDSDRRGLSRIIQAPILALTFLAGPAGMFLYLLVTRVGGSRSSLDRAG